jgi:uroporphyrin-3 C-methyltransferase
LTLTHLTLLVLVVVFVWQWLDAHSQLNQTQHQVASRLSEVEATNKANQLLLAQNQELVRELGGKLSLVETRYAESQNQRAALESLYQEMSSSRDQTALAEVEQMLLIAGQQLQLSGNVKAALIAMQQAESRLQRPAFAGLRKRINQDIDKLRALPSIDVPAINLRLDGVIGAVDKLVLAQDTRIQPQQPVAASDSAEGAWKRFWRELGQESKRLVLIENTERQEIPLLSPTQAFFLRENLKLRLLSARMALLTRDEVSFRRDLKTSQEWLKRYFDTKSNESAQALGTLQKLAASSIVIEMPDISGSLEAVRNYRVSHERGAR